MNNLVSRRTLIRRIEKAWDNCNDSDKEIGSEWYDKAYGKAVELADTYGLPVDTVIAVIANTSPRTHWDRNLKIAEIICAGGWPRNCLQIGVIKSIAALNSDNPVKTVSGPKTEAFFQNISGNSEPVTIDTWILKAIGLTANDLTDKNYKLIEDAFRTYAHRLAISPSTLQAIIWTMAKRTIKRERKVN